MMPSRATYVANLSMFTCLFLFSCFHGSVSQPYCSLMINRLLNAASYCIVLFCCRLCIPPVGSSWLCEVSAAVLSGPAAPAVSVAGPVLRAAVALSGCARGLAGAVAGGPRGGGGGGSDADFSTCRSRCALGRLLRSLPAASSAGAPSPHSLSHNPNPIAPFTRCPTVLSAQPLRPRTKCLS